jgi:electron transfer flavoprotein alpha subunit
MVLVFAESLSGHIKKTALEAVSYGYKVAQLLGTEVSVITVGNAEGAEKLAQYGASKVYNVAASGFDSQVYASVIAQAAEKVGATVVVLAHSSTGKSIAGRLAVRLSAGNISGATSLPVVEGGALKVRKGVFSGKAIAEYTLATATKIISIMGNTFAPEVVNAGASASVETLAVNAPVSKVKVRSQKTVEGVVPLPEAELVVSAGRGMKGPENWGIVEEMATILGATTACSRPVADVHWRPHHEHVGQTGVAIRPNLYIAIGISGAIQHLAGVNQSKCIVVINKDPEAPFFKAADYGVVGDLFEVVPRLNAALKAFKAANH